MKKKLDHVELWFEKYGDKAVFLNIEIILPMELLGVNQAFVRIGKCLIS